VNPVTLFGDALSRSGLAQRGYCCISNSVSAPVLRAILIAKSSDGPVSEHPSKARLSPTRVIIGLVIGLVSLAMAGPPATPTVAGFANDRTGDGVVGPGIVVQDMTRIRAYGGLTEPTSSEESLQISLRFAQPIALNGSGTAEDLTGLIEIDVDRNPATGKTDTFYNSNCPQPVTLGSDLQINLYSDASDGDVDVETENGVVLGQAPIEVTAGSSTLTVDLPFSLLGSSDPVNLVAAVGNTLSITDCAADGRALTSIDRRTFNGRDEYENDDTPLLANYTGGAFAQAPLINMSELQFRTFDSANDAEWFFSTSAGLSISFIISPESPNDPGFRPVIDFYDGEILTNPATQPIASAGSCSQTGELSFVWGSAFMRIRNCPDPLNPFSGTYRLIADGFSQIDPPGAKVEGTISEQGSGAPVPYVYVVSDLNSATFSAPGTGYYQMQADGTMTLSIVDSVFTAPSQTFTAPPSGTVTLNFVVTRIEAVFANGFE
jgi:hypothetical protein